MPALILLTIVAAVIACLTTWLYRAETSYTAPVVGANMIVMALGNIVAGIALYFVSRGGTELDGELTFVGFITANTAYIIAAFLTRLTTKLM